MPIGVYERRPRHVAERFVTKVDVNGPTMPHMATPCHVWTGLKSKQGYGRLHAFGRIHKAHRVAFFIAEGRWPEPCALHRCDNPPCVRRDHLFEGTNADNVADKVSKGRTANQRKTHCPHGHPYSGENLYRQNNSQRGCWTCRRAGSRARIARTQQRRADAKALKETP